MKKLFLLSLLLTALVLAQISIQGTGTITLDGTWTVQRGAIATLVVTTTSLPDGTEQAAYSQNLAATGGDGSYTWVLAPGSNALPSGLTLATNGTISGTPTAPGTFPFTVCVSDGQVAGEACDEPDIWDDQLLAIVIDPAAPAGGEIFTANGDDTGDTSAFACHPTCIGLTATSTGLVDGNKEFEKASDGFATMLSGVDDALHFGRFTFTRTTGMVIAASQYNFFELRDSTDAVLARCGPETDFDFKCNCTGQSPFFFLKSVAEGETIVVRYRYQAGTADDGEFDVILNNGTPASFTACTEEGNIDKVGFNEENASGTNEFITDMLKVRTDTFPDYEAPSPNPPPPLTNCFNTACAVSYTVPTGADRLTYCFVHSEGTDRDPSGVSSSVDGALTEVGTGNDANGVQTTLWVKLNATTGAHTITASFPGGSDEVESTVLCDTRTGVSSTTAEATATNSTASGTSLTSTITTASTDPVIVAGLTGSLNGTGTASSSGMVEIGDSPGGQTPTPGMFGTAAYRLASGTPAARNMNFSVTGGPMALTWFAASFPIVAVVAGTELTSYSAVCDGVTDDGPEIQNAFNDRANWTNNTLIFPAVQTCISGTKLNAPTTGNWTILGQGATIKAQDGLTSTDGQGLLDVDNVTGFEIDTLNIDGNRANRTFTGEPGGGDNLRFRNSHSGTVRSMISKNAGNDNLRVAASNPASSPTVSSDITFHDSKFLNARRNNVSVIEGYNIRFLGTCSQVGGSWFNGTCTCEFSGANGTDPQAGIDWEPNSGSLTPAITDGVVDGCLHANNVKKPYSEVNGKVHNMTWINSIIRGNGGGDGLTLWGFGGLYENNYFTIDETTNRFAWLDFRAHTSVATDLNPARVAKFQNNFISGTPPVGYTSGVARLVAFGNCNPPSVACGPDGVTSGNGDNSTEFKNNAVTNTSLTASGDWCNAGPTGNENPGTSGNTFNGSTQVPNPGCP